MFALPMMYSVADGFLCQQLIRESALNYFAVVDTAAMMALKKGKARTRVSEKELRAAGAKLGISEADHGAISKASRTRNLLAHGHPDQLLITQHSLGVYPATSFSLKLPALACKAAADAFLRAMFAV